MEVLRHLSLEEAHALKEILTSLSERAKQPLSLNQLLRQWRDFVVRIERGYKDSIYEYSNELSVRNLLEEILHHVTPSLREELLRLIKPWDERFDKATSEVARPLSSKSMQGVTHRWWFRIPKHFGREFEGDLRSEGILS